MALFRYDDSRFCLFSVPRHHPAYPVRSDSYRNIRGWGPCIAGANRCNIVYRQLDSNSPTDPPPLNGLLRSPTPLQFAHHTTTHIPEVLDITQRGNRRGNTASLIRRHPRRPPARLHLNRCARLRPNPRILVISVSRPLFMFRRPKLPAHKQQHLSNLLPLFQSRCRREVKIAIPLVGH